MKEEYNRTIITDIEGNEFVYLNFIREDEHYLIPYIDVPGRSKKYWEHHFISKDSWILIDNNTNFDNYSISKDDFQSLLKHGKDSYEEILKKYHDSF